MPKDTKKLKRRAAVICASIVIAYLGCILAFIVFPGREAFVEITAAIFLSIFSIIIIAVIAGIILALRQRLKEIESGEEDEAKKY